MSVSETLNNIEIAWTLFFFCSFAGHVHKNLRSCMKPTVLKFRIPEDWCKRNHRCREVLASNSCSMTAKKEDKEWVISSSSVFFGGLFIEGVRSVDQKYLILLFLEEQEQEEYLTQPVIGLGSSVSLCFMYGVWSNMTEAEFYVKDRTQFWELGLDQSLDRVSGGLKSLAKAVDKWGKECAN